MSPHLSHPAALTLVYGVWNDDAHTLPKSHHHFAFARDGNDDATVMFVVKNLNVGWQKEVYLGPSTGQNGFQIGEVTKGKLLLRGQSFYSEDIHRKYAGWKGFWDSSSRFVKNPFDGKSYLWHHESVYSVSNITLKDPETKEVLILSKAGKHNNPDTIEFDARVLQHLEVWILEMLMYRGKLQEENDQAFNDNIIIINN
ncbi:hypothetical protein MNV49_006032 [Pseudohyphozyma bogoriensis]|nr:hypothetical protein MNV49_006032 [Pseudohyphozyma bogoriensis]